MNQERIYADAYQTSFVTAKEMLEFLMDRTKSYFWIRKPTKSLKLMPLNEQVKEKNVFCSERIIEILDDTERNTNLLLKVSGNVYPVRDCAIQTILSRAGINGSGLRKLDKATYSKVVNYCLKVAKGDALIKIADGKVSAVHGGDAHDYCVLDMQEVFAMTSEYLYVNFRGSNYMEGSGTYDHSIVSAMWKLGGSQELLDVYRKALSDHGMKDQIEAPALRLVTSDVAASGVNLYPMLLCDNSSRSINLGSPIKLAHDKGATLADFRKNLNLICSRYQDAITDMTKLMDIEIKNPSNCLRLVMKKIGIKKKLINEVVELFEAQNGINPCSAHDLYYAINEAAFLGACEGLRGHSIINLEENITKAISLDWREFDISGAIKW